jgi:hypothetical protein
MTTANKRRSAAVRLHHSNPSAVAAIKARVHTLTLEDRQAKEIALVIDRSIKNACNWITALGFRRMYVTAEERAHIMARRAKVEKVA